MTTGALTGTGIAGGLERCTGSLFEHHLQKLPKPGTGSLGNLQAGTEPLCGTLPGTDMTAAAGSVQVGTKVRA